MALTRSLPRASLLLILLAGTAGPLRGAQIEESAATNDLASLPTGRVIERVTSRSNRREQYAVFLPAAYRTDRTWPLLALLDPRGRALLPLERIREVADRLGYLVLSSYNSRSDETVDPNADAINAMLDDADQMLAIDPARIYLVGQSGTARAGWIFGAGLRGHVAGLIGIGAATPNGFPLAPRPEGAPPGMVFFGAAGTDDYNFDEMWLLDHRLDSLNLPHRITWFDGPHSWPPAATLTEAVEWMELQAMKFGLKPADPAWIEALLAHRMAAAALTEGRDPHHAWRAYRDIVADFTGLRDVGAAAAMARELERRPEVRHTERHLGDLVRQQTAYADHLGGFLGDLRQGKPPTTGGARKQLRLADLAHRASDRSDTLAAHAATRGLEHVWVYTSFYEPREYLSRDDPTRALAVLDIAESLRPNDPDVCLYRAEALIRLDRRDEALRAVECAARGGVSPWRLERDPRIASLLAAPGERVALARLSAGGAGSRYWN